MLSDLGAGISNALQGFFGSKEGEKELNDAIKKITTSLLGSNVSTRVVLNVRKRILERFKLQELPTKAGREKALQKIVFEELCGIMDSGKEPFKPKKKETSTVLFVGLQGSGKTTTCCKYAKYYKQRGFKVGIVCADTFRAGAYEQVKQNVQGMNIEVFISDSSVDPSVVAQTGASELKEKGCNLILVDTSGRHTQEGELFKEMEDIVRSIDPTASIFVVDASIGQAAEIHARSFMSRVKLGSVIITKTDGTKNIGGALCSVAETKTPVAFIGTGEGMGHIESFNPKGFVGKLMGLGDITAFAEKLEGLNISVEKQEELIGKISAGEFSMEDFYEYYKKILELGPISQLFSLVPGLSSSMSMLNEKEFKKMGTVFAAMTKKELRTNGEVFIRSLPRLVRVAKGSGVTPTQVRDTVNSYRMMAQMFQRLSSNPMFAGLLGGKEGAANKEITPDAARAQLNQLKKMMPPGFSSMFDQFDKFF
ncbi:signal recognition particle subunit SRP54 [Nematocida minor]|uniref:signal recognition particle subunit SRP54 n=1 Tax=Nematocida minor TaxID=1912983 RepID=UPI00221FCCBB|nr:signal recognition particle subunit SRP54 [Nematocida minor]KAI5189671.1 signal recognition particle subunit SRP54 [Nematocida minor]